MTKYQNKYSCNKCGEGKNEITKIITTDAGHVSECKTKCTKCGFVDYWVYGFFNSSEFIEPKAKEYCS